MTLYHTENIVPFSLRNKCIKLLMLEAVVLRMKMCKCYKDQNLSQ